MEFDFDLSDENESQDGNLQEADVHETDVQETVQETDVYEANVHETNTSVDRVKGEKKETARVSDGSVSMTRIVGEHYTVAKSSYSFETVVPYVYNDKPLKTYRVQRDFGEKERMDRGYQEYYMPLLPTSYDGHERRQPIYAMLPLLTQGTTAPYMPPPKINDPNMKFNWTHLVDSWPLRSNMPCSNCMHKFESIPWMIPIKRIESYYKMDDSEHVFCSYPCMRRFLMSSGYADKSMYLVYANDIARNYFKWAGELLAAPPRLWLQTMTIDEYRSHLVPPPFFEFASRPVGYDFDASRESKWMSEMTVLRPPFLSGTAIMYWVLNAVPRANQAAKVLIDSYRPSYAQIAQEALLMGPLRGGDSGLSRERLAYLKENYSTFKPWSVEGLSVPLPEQIEETEQHRIVMPPLDPFAPALIDEIAKMRREMAEGKEPSFSKEAEGASYLQEFEGALKSKQGKKVVTPSGMLQSMLDVTTEKKQKQSGAKRAQKVEKNVDQDVPSEEKKTRAKRARAEPSETKGRKRAVYAE